MVLSILKVNDKFNVFFSGGEYKPLPCPLCGKLTKSKSAFGSHLKRIHGIGLAEFVYTNFTNKTPDFKVEKCGFCDRDAIPIMTVDFENREFSLSYDGYMCMSEECIDNICIDFFGAKHDKVKNQYEHIGAKTKFLAKKYKQTEEFVKYNIKRDKDFVMPKESRTSLEGYILRYGEEDGRKKYKERCDKIGYSMTVDWYIERFGVEEGTKKYEERINKTVTKAADIKHSKHQYEIYESLKENDSSWEDERYAGGVGVVDMLNKKLKVVIEYFGDYWHCNPEVYSDDYYHKTLCLTAKEKQNKDKIRLNKILLSENVDKIIVVWEKRFHEEGLTNVLKKIYEFIKDEKLKGKVIWL